MTAASLALLLVVSADTLTGDWQGRRTELANFGLSLDLVYTAEAWYVFPQDAYVALGHMDLALTLETQKLGIWAGGKVYVLGQASVGQGVNDLVGSANEVSNLEARRFTQVAELFYEQTLFDEKVHVRIGKQDANRDFGTPRYSGNFINNNFGMYPTAPLPSYPTTGLGATVLVDPLEWLSLRAALYQGNPEVGKFDVHLGDGALAVGGVNVKHRWGLRNGGITSLGVWGHTDGRFGVMFQNDERIFSHPLADDDGRGLDLISRLSVSKGGDVPLYAGLSLAWHGLWARENDTVGAGVGFFTLTAGGSELFFEVFYKARVTAWFSVQPDLEFYRTPGGTGRNAALLGLRLKLKL